MNPTAAKGLMPGLLDAFDSEKVYKFLHLPVQSGDDGVLREMWRGYTAEEFRKIVDEFKKASIILFKDVVASAELKPC